MQSHFDFFVEQREIIKDKSAGIIGRWYRRIVLLRKEDEMRKKRARAERLKNRKNRIPGQTRPPVRSTPKPSPPKMVKAVSTPSPVKNIVPTPTAEEKAAKSSIDVCPVQPENTIVEQAKENEEPTPFITQANPEIEEKEDVLAGLPVKDDLLSQCSEREEEEEGEAQEDSLEQTQSLDQTGTMDQTLSSICQEQPAADED